MVNPFKEVNWKPDQTERRKFAKSLVIGFPCVAVLLLVLRGLTIGTWNFNVPVVVGGIGFALGLVLLILPGIARPFYIAWYFLSCCIGILVGNLLLALMFYVFLTGMGLLRRIGGRGPIRKVPDRKAVTYWRDAEPAADLRRYYRQF